MNLMPGSEDSPISAATIGAGIGIILGPMGVLAGSLIGGVVDVALGARSKAKARKKMKRAFVAQLLKRYDTQIFISSLERMASAIEYLATLGLKPGVPEFDEYLKKLLFTEIGYKGNCAIDLYGPKEAGKTRPIIAKIDTKGVMTAISPSIDTALGPKWLEACKELHKAALQDWAEDQKESILIERELSQEKEKTRQVVTTKLLVNAGVIMLILGYTLRTKRKLKALRVSRNEEK